MIPILVSDLVTTVIARFTTRNCQNCVDHAGSKEKEAGVDAGLRR
jgi:hypothetical protein